MERIKYFDIETFQNCFMIVGQYDDWNEDQFEVYINPTVGNLISFLNNGRLMGFNNHKFDDIVLAGVMNRALENQLQIDDVIPPQWAFELGQEIINKEPDRFMSGLLQVTEDVMRYRDFETNSLNLKSFESMLGMEIVETEYDFLEPLPNEEAVQSTLYYCKNDVVATRRAYKFLEKKGAVEAVVAMRNWAAQKLQVDPETLVKKSTNSIMINLMQNPVYDRQNFFDFIERGKFDYAFADPEFKAWYEKAINYVDDPLKLEGLDLHIERNNVAYDFGMGGGHYVDLNSNAAGKCIDRDWQSLYPNIIILILGLGEECTALFKEIVDTRIAAKKTNEALAQGLKLFINSLYGLCRSFNSGAQLYNKYLGLDVCIAGQVMLYDITKRIEEVGVIMKNGNTDGLIYEVKDELEPAIDKICDEFSERTGISMDSDTFDYYFAKDVNNYFCLNIEEDEITVAKTKGVFSSKPYYSNLASSKYVIDYFIKQVAKERSMDFLEPSMERLAETNLNDFIIRAKNTKNYEFTYGLTSEYVRYGKNGKELKKRGIEFIPITSLGKQFRGYATRDGYDIQNLNKQTGKYGYSTALKTKKFPTNVWHEATPTTLNYDYYLDQALELIQSIEKVA